MFFNNVFLSLVKVTALFVCNLSGMFFIYYHIISHNLSGYVFKNIFLGSKITVIFVCELSALLCVYYHDIYTSITGVYFPSFFPWVKVIAMFVSNCVFGLGKNR